MNNSYSTNGVFIPSGCISAEVMKEYAMGVLDADTRSLVETHISTCKLCSDAINGLKNSADIQNLDSSLSRLQRKLRARVLENPKTDSLNRRKGRSGIIRNIAIAAGILLIAGVFSLIYLNNRLDKSVSESNISLSNTPKPLLKDATGEAKSESVDMKNEAGTIPALKSEPKKKPGNSKKIENLQTITVPETENIIASESLASSDVSGDSVVQLKSELSHINSQPASYLRSNTTSEKIAPDKFTNESKKDNPSVQNSKASGMAADESLSEVVVMSNGAKNKSRKISVATSSAEMMDAKEAVKIASKMPAFNGKGIEEFEKYITENLIYPKKAIEDKIEGTVYISFIVDSLGKVTKVYSLKDSNKILEKEAIRVVNSSPKWEPGNDNGVPVKVQLTVPVKFRLK